jgi:hypothetical protein
MSELAELHPRRLATSLLQDVTGPVTAAVAAGKDAAGVPVQARGSISSVVPPPAAPALSSPDAPPTLSTTDATPPAVVPRVAAYDDDAT